MGEFFIIVIYVLLGTLIGSLLSLIPSLHIYNVAGIALLIWTTSYSLIPYEAVAPFFMSLVVSFAFINTIPMTFLGAADESAAVTILPGTRCLSLGTGFDAAMMSAVGSMIGLGLLIILTPFFFYCVPYINKICGPHLHWIIVLIIVFMLMSEWPKGLGLGKTTLEKFLTAWSNLFAGIATFVLAAILGIIALTKPLVSYEMGFQNIMPIFVGLFAFPSILQSLIAGHEIPKQHIGDSIDVDPLTLGRSAFQGTIGGLLAAYLPAVTAGIGGIISGHMTAQRGDRIFMVSGGTMKVLYYVGAFMFLFVLTPLSPSGIGRGGLAIILKPVLAAEPGDYFIVLAAVILSGCLSFLMMEPLIKATLFVVERVGYKAIYIASFLVVLGIIFYLTGLPGVFVSMVAMCIGSIPVFYHCRRSNCMAVLLVPIALNMAGLDGAITTFLGLA